MNRLTELFDSGRKDLLNIYVTCGYPKFDSLPVIISELESAGADMVEIGMPYSDPLADGPTIQATSTVALENGMTMEAMFEQVAQARSMSSLPFIYMGYLNQLLQYGIDKFLSKAIDSGIDALIIPDLPADIYETTFRVKVEESGLRMIFLVTPQTSDERLRLIDHNTTGFIYLVSSNSITGQDIDMESSQKNYFERIQNFGLESPTMIGFGIHDKVTFDMACKYSRGAIIGSAFLKELDPQDLHGSIVKFVQKIKF